jgi:hypothetical protein
MARPDVELSLGVSRNAFGVGTGSEIARKHYLPLLSQTFSTRVLLPSEVIKFGQPVYEINWGVTWNDKIVALFQAQDDGDGWLAVHANVPRHTIHPTVTYLYARQFADRLLELGAVGLKAEIEVKNRAAIRVAKAAGFVEQTRNDEWVVLTRLPNG